MKAVILAGGYGTRLRPLTYTKPKSMLPLLKKPILQHIVENLAAQGFDELIVTTNYLKKQIINHFGDGKTFGVKMIYPKEDKPLGTAGSVKNVEERLDETFAVVQGDVVSEINLKAVMDFHEEKGSIATLALTSVENPGEYGIVEVDSTSKIVRFMEKPKSAECFSNLVNTGIYILDPELLKYIPTNGEYDFGKDLFPQLLTKGKKLYGHRSTDFWIDIGQSEKYLAAIRWALERRKGKNTFELKKAVTPPMGHPLSIGDEANVDPTAKIKGPAIIGDGCRIGKDAVIEGSSIIEPGVEVADRARITSSVIYQSSYVGYCSYVRHSIVAEECRIGSHVEIETSVIGAGCTIGKNVVLHQGSKVWPNIQISANSTMRGIIQPVESEWNDINNFKDRHSPNINRTFPAIIA